MQRPAKRSRPTCEANHRSRAASNAAEGIASTDALRGAWTRPADRRCRRQWLAPVVARSVRRPWVAARGTRPEFSSGGNVAGLALRTDADHGHVRPRGHCDGVGTVLAVVVVRESERRETRPVRVADLPLTSRSTSSPPTERT